MDSYPDYYVIDRAGKLRVADLANADLEKAIKTLLAEPGGVHPALAEASATAIKKDKRILVLWGTEAERGQVDRLLRESDLRTLLRNEYEVVRLEPAGNFELAQTLKARYSDPDLTVLDAQGAVIARFEAQALVEQTLSEFLQAHRVPVKDAEELWRQALAQAQREKKNVLVHLGAPW